MSGKATSSKAFMNRASSVWACSGTFTQYPAPAPTPVSSSKPVPGKKYLPLSCSEMVSTRSVS